MLSKDGGGSAWKYAQALALILYNHFSSPTCLNIKKLISFSQLSLLPPPTLRLRFSSSSYTSM